jgi:Flp pilus assembly protein TadD
MRGDFDTAEPMYARALTLAVNVEDRELEAMVAQNLGVIASVRGDLTAALDYYRSSLAIYRAQSLHRQIGHTLNNMGLVYTQMECFDDARAHTKKPWSTAAWRGTYRTACSLSTAR